MTLRWWMECRKICKIYLKEERKKKTPFFTLFSWESWRGTDGVYVCCCVCLFVASWGWRGGGKSSLLVRLRSQCPHDGQKTTETKVPCRTHHTSSRHWTFVTSHPQQHFFFFLFLQSESFSSKFFNLVYLSGMLSLLTRALKPAWLKIELVKWSSCFGSVYSRRCFSIHCSVILFKTMLSLHHAVYSVVPPSGGALHHHPL